ncbi:MAG: hypothetical protein HY959_12550 [Ignavibacteriae bacterium]|nr:hypothetical protein [Ignavibacteriota bacterium]
MKKNIIVLILLLASLCHSQTGNLQVTYMRDLDFQQIIPGVFKTITETSPYAGKFVITGDGTRMTVSVAFNLSQNIISGSKQIPVRYTATHSIYPNDNQPGIPFDPYAGTTLIFDDKIKEYYVKIGGTISPANVQLSGVYNSSVIIILTTVAN